MLRSRDNRPLGAIIFEIRDSAPQPPTAMTVNRMFCDPPTRQGSNLRASAAFPFPPRRGPWTGSTALLMNPAPLSIIHFYFIIMSILNVSRECT